MGSLTLPLFGLVYLDASGLIHSVERVEPYRTLLEPMWQEAQDGNLIIVSSPVLVIEALVKPLRDGNTEIELQYLELFASNAVRLLDASYQVFEDAARLRAETGLKMPDALHAATALRVDCALFGTNDTDCRRVQALPVVVLDDLPRYSLDRESCQMITSTATARNYSPRGEFYRYFPVIEWDMPTRLACPPASARQCMMAFLGLRENGRVRQITRRFNSPPRSGSAGEPGGGVEGYDHVENSANASGANRAMAAYFVRNYVNRHLNELVRELRDRLGSDSHPSCRSIGIRV